jgi:D-arabinose 1-dehydrogenase-like Zn-dependent alcohol dehydrogenase
VLRAYKEPLQVEELAVEAPHVGEIAVKVAAAGVCHSDLYVLEGATPVPPPLVSGHEAVGVVEEVGPGVDGFSPGDYVVTNFIWPCGRCKNCASGRENLCENFANVRLKGTLLDGTTRLRDSKGGEVRVFLGGTWAERAVIPATAVAKIPGRLVKSEMAMLGCAFLTAYGAVVNTGAAGNGDTVVVIGTGGVGLAAVQLAKAVGARVVAVGRNPAKLATAEEMGPRSSTCATEIQSRRCRSLRRAAARMWSYGLMVLWYEDVPDYPHPGVWWEITDTYGVTHILFSPTALRLLMRCGEEWPLRYELDTLMALYPAGEVLNEEAYHWMVKYLCRGRENCQVADIWGQTKTACFVTAPGSMNLGGFRYKYGSMGLPYPTLRIAILNDEGKELPPGEKGPVAVKPPLPPAFLHTLWRDPERYVKSCWSTFPGYYLTGDIGYLDEEGYLYVLGRSDDVIKIAGHRLSTREVEDILTAHPAVAEAAVVGIPDPVRGEVLGIFVVPKMDAKITEEEVAQHIRKTLGPVAVVGRVVILNKLPKTRTGKVMRRDLRAYAS